MASDAYRNAKRALARAYRPSGTEVCAGQWCGPHWEEATRRSTALDAHYETHCHWCGETLPEGCESRPACSPTHLHLLWNR